MPSTPVRKSGDGTYVGAVGWEEPMIPSTIAADLADCLSVPILFFLVTET